MNQWTQVLNSTTNSKGNDHIENVLKVKADENVVRIIQDFCGGLDFNLQFENMLIFNNFNKNCNIDKI